MRILFCNFEYPPLGGGGGVSTAVLAQEMAKHHDVTVLTSRATGLSAEETENGVRVVRVPVFFRRQEAVANIPSMFMFIPMAIEAGKRILMADQYDIINTHFVLPSGPVGDALSRASGIPNVVTLLGGDVYDPSKFTSPHRHPLLRAWIRQLLRRADTVVGDSSNTLDNMRRFYAPEIDGVRIPLGIQKPMGTAAPRARYGCNEQEILLVTVGRLVARKGVAQLISLIDSLTGAKVRLFVLGSGPEERFLKEAAVKRQLKDQVLFMGHVEEDEKFRILQMCDIYVSTSQHEGFGLVFLEAMACGLPVVCYDHGGQTDFLHDQETGYLVPLNNTDLFKERCRLLIGNPRLCETIGKNNKRRVKEFYINECARKYEATFNELLAINGKARRLWLPQSHTT